MRPSCKNWRKATKNAVELTITSSLTRLHTFNNRIHGVLDSLASAT